MVTPDLHMLQKLLRPSAHPPPLGGGAVHRRHRYAWAMEAEATATTEESPTVASRALALRPISQGTLARTVPPGDALRELPSIVMAGLAALYGFTQATMLLRTPSRTLITTAMSWRPVVTGERLTRCAGTLIPGAMRHDQ